MEIDYANGIVARAGDAGPWFTEACAAAGIRIVPRDFTPPSTAGLWPGIRHPPSVKGRGDEVTSASREPWVDANGYLAAWLRALHPDRAPLLGYLPDRAAGLEPDRAVPFDTLELALIEAWAAGGNYLLSLEPRYQAALSRGEEKAKEAWTSLVRTSRWLRDNIRLFRTAPFDTVTALVESGEETAEIANLLYRRNASPALARADRPPAPSAARRALVAANIRPPSPEARARMLANAESGSTLVVAPPAGTGASANWWSGSSNAARLKLVRSEADRDFYSLGRGQVVAYQRPVNDPSEFALDVIDIVAHRNRAVRLWNAPAVVALAAKGAAPGQAIMHLVNYGSPVDSEIQARIQGSYRKGQLIRPEGAPIELKPAGRGTTTEVMVPELRRLGVVVFG